MPNCYFMLQVGSFLKEPKSTVWVVHIEGHFSVLFSLADSISKVRD